MTKRFRNLSPAQERVFEQIAVNADGGHPQSTLAVLVRKGLIEAYEEKQGGSFPRMTITRYFVPIPVHMEWCEWCAATVEETDDAIAAETATQQPAASDGRGARGR